MAEIGQLSYSIILNDKDFNKQALEIQKKLKNVDAAITGLAAGDSKKIAEPFNVAGLSIDRMIAQAKTLEATFKALSQNGMGDLSVEAQNLRMRWQEIQAILQKYGYSIRSSTMEQQTMIGALKMQENTVGQIELKMRALQSVLKNIDRTQKDGIDTIKKINDEYMRLGDVLKKVGARQYNLADLARNTNGAFSPLGFSIQQVARELPSLTMGAQMFFLAISNNLPILSDELRKAKESYKALVAEGKTAVPVWKQVLSSIFSWQTAMVVGITLLTMYGREIGNWIKGLFGAKKANEELNATLKETYKSLGSEIAELDSLFKSLNNTKKGTDEYKKSKNKIIEQFGKYYNSLELEKILIDDSARAYRILADSIYEAAKAKALQDSRGKAGATLVQETEDNLKEIRDTLISSLGENEGRSLFMQIRKELQDTGKVSDETLKKLDEFNQNLSTNYGGKKYDLQLNKPRQTIKIAIDNITNAQNEYNQSIIESEELLGDLFSRMGEGSKEAVSLIKEAEDALKRAQLMPDETYNQLQAKNKAIKDAQDRLKYLNSLGVPDKKELNQLNSMARAEEQLGKTRRKVENENLKFDLEMRQKAIGIMEDSYAKKYAQLLLNNQKELQALKEHGDDLIDEQQKIERAQWQKAGSKGVFVTKTNTVSDLPKETQDQMKRMFKAISAEFDRGYQLLNREEQDWLDEANMMFADSLQKRLFEINKHYRDEFLAAKGNYERQVVLRRNKEKEITKAILDEDIKRIEFQLDLDEKRLNSKREVLTFEASKEEKLLKKRIEAQKKILNKLDRQLFKGDNSQELRDRIAQARAELEGLNRDLEDIKLKKAKELYSIFSQTSDILGEISGLDMSMLDSFAEMGFSMASSGSWLSAASSGVSAIIGMFNNLIPNKEKELQIQREINKLQQQYNIDLRQQNVDLISSIDYARVFRNNMEALQWLVEKGFISNVDYSAWDTLNSQFVTLEKNISGAQKEYDKYVNQGNDILKGFSNGLIYNVNSTVRRAVDEWRKGIAAGDKDATLNALQILSTGDWSWTDKVKDLVEQLSAANGEVTSINDQMAELSQQMDEFATGTNFDGFLNDAMTAIDNMRKGVSNLSDFTEESLTNAILSSFKYQVLAEALKPLYDQLADKFIKDFDNLDKTWGDQWQKDLENKLKEAGVKFEDVFGKLGVDNSSERTGLSGSLARASQDSIDELTGVMYAGLEKLSLTSNGINAINITTTAMSAELKAQTMLLRSIDNYSSNLPYMRTGIETMVNQGVRIKSV